MNGKNVFGEWKRIVFDGTPLYVRPECPDWFVPNEKLDRLLKAYGRGEQSHDARELKTFLKRIASESRHDYAGRAQTLSLDRVKECWIHVTNRCNLRCRHCMFSSSPSSSHELSADALLRLIDEAVAIGSTIFYFTGGEPFLHETLIPALERIFASSDTHVVILTNLTLIHSHARSLDRFPRNRLHFQISVDGTEEHHDLIRGKGAFSRVRENLEHLRRLRFPATLAMTVTKNNVSDMDRIIDFAEERGISNVHFLWLFKRGLAGDSLVASPDDIFPNVVKAQKKGEQRGIKIDNIEIFRSQVFSFPGTKHDLCNAGWQSLAVGPDGFIYPSPALVYVRRMRCGHLEEGVERVWKTSPVLTMTLP